MTQNIVLSDGRKRRVYTNTDGGQYYWLNRHKVTVEPNANLINRAGQENTVRCSKLKRTECDQKSNYCTWNRWCRKKEVVEELNQPQPVNQQYTSIVCSRLRKQKCQDALNCNWQLGKGCKRNVNVPVESPAEQQLPSAQQEALVQPLSMNKPVANVARCGKIESSQQCLQKDGCKWNENINKCKFSMGYIVYPLEVKLLNGQIGYKARIFPLRRMNVNDVNHIKVGKNRVDVENEYKIYYVRKEARNEMDSLNNDPHVNWNNAGKNVIGQQPLSPPADLLNVPNGQNPLVLPENVPINGQDPLAHLVGNQPVDGAEAVPSGAVDPSYDADADADLSHLLSEFGDIDALNLG